MIKYLQNIKKKKVGFGHLFGFALFAVYMIGNFFMPEVADLLVLKPEAVLQNFEIWRVLTYPLYTNDAAGLLLFLYAGCFVAPRLEKMFSIYKFSLIIPLLLLVQGVLYTFAFSAGGHILYGAEAATISILLLPVMIYARRFVFEFLFSLRRYVHISLMLFVSWTCITLYRSTLSSSGDVIMNSIISLGFAYFAALMVMNRINAILEMNRSEFMLAKLVSSMPFPDIEEQDKKDIEQSEGFVENVKQELDHANKKQIYKDMLRNEDALNRVLDKMNEYGKESLTEDERKFLFDYSKNMK